MSEIKPSYESNRILLGEHLPLSTPFSIILSTSERCNFRCSYCFRSSKKDESWGFAASEEIIGQDIFDLTVSQLSEFPEKIKTISLSGHGEPLCNSLLEHMASKLRQAGVAEKIEMHTNASLLTPMRALKIASAGFTRIVVSLQGLTSEDYLRVCGAKINWDEFYRNIKILYENKPDDLKIHIKISDAAIKQGEDEKFYDLFDNMADSLYIENAVPLWKNVSLKSNKTVNKYGSKTTDICYCSLVFYTLLISPGGDIYPCTRLPSPNSLGNISDISLFQAWNSRERLEFLKEHLRLTRHGHAPCAGCFIPINTVVSQEDNIDPFKEVIWDRMMRAAFMAEMC